MPKEAKTETIGFRCTPDFKKQMIETAYSKSMEPSEYMHEVIKSDINKKLSEPGQTEKTFIEETLDKQTDKILSFVSANVTKRLNELESKLLTNEGRALKEYQTARTVLELVTANQSKLKIREETQQKWYKQIYESTDIDKDIAEINKTIAEAIQKNDDEKKVKKQPK